ncbi:MAG: osmotically inducible protein OsmC [Bacteroidetes bacterium]|nr:osmotically inducible protein OsmC [Bacteroidota bacterium]|tara:strand:- start:102 stop:512 length:411 start_codon:yes stop_codon:yes gene_type:complete
MPTIKMTYKGDLRTEATHLQSGSKIFTDAPTDNKGKGEAFSPTDLVANALGACILTIIGISANANDFNIDGTEIDITKTMVSNPRRIGEIEVIINLPHDNYSAREKRLIESAARTCPVGKSLHPETKETIVFNYGK